ncbi:MAG: hypothetical protein LBQ60_06245 [Bacteroidales bacterium]|jgi:hypothetical protein|nr:hypothetical protein [Bacteroidales bacterium]
MRKVILIQLILVFSVLSSFGQWQTSGNNIYFNNGNVGIGTINPSAIFEIAGNKGSLNDRNFRVRYYDYENDIYLKGAEFSALTNIPEKTGGNGWTALYAKQGNAGKAGVFDGDVVIHGNVGIGTTSIDNGQGWQKVLDIYGPQHAKLLVRGNEIKTGIFSDITWSGQVGRVGTESNHDLRLIAGYTDRMTIKTNGNVGIGTVNPAAKLTVAGDILAREIVVEANAGADFVFEENYRLKPLKEVEQFIAENKHLPDIAPADTMIQNGVNMGEFQIQLLQKIEELTLYVIKQEKENEVLKKHQELQQKRMEELTNELKKLKKEK